MKIIILGDKGVGKTSFINRHLTGDFKDVPVNFNDQYVQYHTNHGLIDIMLTDMKYMDDLKCYDAAIIMFDCTKEETYDNIPNYFELIQEHAPNINNIVICGNKVDIPQRVVKSEMINYHRQYDVYYYDISNKSNYNFDKPITYLMQKHFSPDLKLIEY